MIKILLTGKNGQLGWELNRTFSTLGNLFAFDHSSLDLNNHEQLQKTIRSIEPDLIINAAAYTNVDAAEQNQDLAMAINSTALEVITEEIKKIDGILIHYSTDYVFDGSKHSAYTEEDLPSPINVYGKSKLSGELVVQKSGVPYFIFRTSWVYATRGNNFLLTMLRLMQEQKLLSVVNNQFGVPTWSRFAAEVSGQIFSKFLTSNILNKDYIHQLSGIYNLSCKGQTTWYDFAREIYKNLPASVVGNQNITINPVPSSKYHTVANRPENSELSTNKLEENFNLNCLSWQEALSLCMEDLTDNILLANTVRKDQ